MKKFNMELGMELISKLRNKKALITEIPKWGT
jgi:hypothetical protein